jgi:hypothetical protein
LYYFFVFVSEVLGFTPSWLLKLFSTKQRAGLSAGKGKFRLDGEDDDEIEFSGLQNPMIAAGLHGTQKFEELELKLQEQEQLNLELVKLARQNKQTGGGNAAMPPKSRRQRKVKKRVFGQTSAAAPSSATEQRTGEGEGANSESVEIHVDESTGQRYSWNVRTNSTRWLDSGTKDNNGDEM